MLREAIQSAVEGRHLSRALAAAAVDAMLDGSAPASLIAALLVALRVKGETPDEIAGAALALRARAARVVVPLDRLVDTCGTGGDGAHTFNISTAAAFVAAAAGAKVAKHGGRSVSSKSGSADVLEALGVNLALTPAQVAQCIDRTGVGFMFAPNHHSAMKHAAPVRRELGVRTLFNILGPLTNPAGARNQVMGVFHPDLVGIQARVLQRLGSRHVLVVYGMEGLDEISVAGETLVGELKDGEVREYTIHPRQFGMQTSELSEIQVEDGGQSRDMLVGALSNKARPQYRLHRLLRRH